MVKLNVAVPESLHAQLRHLSFDSHQPLTRLVPDLLREAVEARKSEYPTGGTPADRLQDTSS